MILLTGTYNSKNKGDAAMQLVARTKLDPVVDGGVVIASPFDEIDAEFYAPTPVIRSYRRQGPQLLGSLIGAGLAGVLRRFSVTRRLAGPFLVSDELRATAEADLVVDLSGDMLTEGSGVVVGISHFYPLVLAWLLRTPYVVCAQSIGPFDKLRPLAAFLLNRSALTTIREATTLEHLAPLGIEDPTLTADLAFMLEILPDEHWVPKVQSLGATKLGVSVSSILEKRYLEATGGDLVDDLADILESEPFRDLTIVAVSHVTGPAESKDDRVQARRLAERLGSRCLLVDDDLDSRTIKSVIGQCDLFIGARMHANIAALSQGIPTVAMAYSHKTVGIMTSLGIPEFIVGGDELTKDGLTAALHKLRSESDRVASTLSEHLPAMVAAAKTNITLIENELAKVKS